MSDIIYTYTDEAPAMATFSLFPIIKRFLKSANVDIEMMDISLAGRVLANFADYLKPEQQIPDFLKILGDMTKEKSANIIKLPNISASVPQLVACIDELRSKGFMVPNYPSEPKDEKEKDIFARYQKVLGSAVNPVLREGNSDRRSAKAVKEYAKANPHRNGKWDKDTKTEVLAMSEGDFYANEKSHIFADATTLNVEFTNKNGEKKLLKTLPVKKNEVIDATFMSAKKLDEFIAKSIDYAKEKGLLYSVHLKATMMKVSDPVMFGHFVKIFFKEIFEEFKTELASVGVNENNGMKDFFARIENLPCGECKKKILDRYNEILNLRPEISMVDSDNGITNLHVPSDVIIDASMPAMIRNSGKLWNKNGETKFTLAVIPDRSYALIYQAMVNDLKQNGELNPAAIGTVSNVGLMAQKAEEYGSHDKTFIMSEDGEICVKDEKGNEIFKFALEKGDIFRMTQAKDEPIKNWIKLAVNRAKSTGAKAIFWLDKNRAHDMNIKKIVESELKNYDLSGLDIEICDPYDAIIKSNAIIRSGKDCISVTGNVLRDYLTDLYPILELGTSAKMLSIVPLLNGGGLFETGAGGSAPKIAIQIPKENHLRWDSLGEFLALAVSLEHLAEIKNSDDIKIFADTLDSAVSTWLKNDKAPRKNAGEPDNRTSHFYLAMYWADELSKTKFKGDFENLANELKANEEKIMNELLGVQGKAVDMGGYYMFDENKANAVMRPSATLNKIIG